MNGPCQMHFFVDSNGVRQSGHLQKDCRNFQAMMRVAAQAHAQAASRNPQGPRSEIHLPPPPAIMEENRHQLRIAAAPAPPPYVDPNSHGAVSMIQKGRPDNLLLLSLVPSNPCEIFELLSDLQLWFGFRSFTSTYNKRVQGGCRRQLGLYRTSCSRLALAP